MIDLQNVRKISNNYDKSTTASKLPGLVTFREIEGNSSSSSSTNSDCESSLDFEELQLFPLSRSSNSSSSDDFNVTDCRAELAKWSITHNITNDATSALLKILRKHSCFQSMPCDSRTLLKTKKSVKILDIGNGKLCYFGLVTSIAKRLDILSKLNVHLHNLRLDLSIDGLPITKSTTSQFRPIQCAFSDFKFPPFVVAIFHGNGKPSDINLFFQDLMQELCGLIENGLMYKESKIVISLSKIIADAPARSFVKQCKPHNAYSGCEKCTVYGRHLGRILFDEFNSVKRTDDSFALQLDKNHHIGFSPFSKLNFGLVTGVPLDYMHLVCLGVMRKILHAWVKGPLPYKLRASDILRLSSRLTSMSATTPKEFGRRPRSLREVDMWKATEFRTFLLFTGPVVLKGILPRKLYNHFMLFHVGILSLVSPSATNTEWNLFAESLLRKFVKLVPTYYSPLFIVYNIHSLIHLAADVRLHGPEKTNSPRLSMKTICKPLNALCVLKTNHLNK